MKRIDVTMNGKQYVFRTNNNGEFLFTGVSENNQISCDGGFLNKKRAQKTIREYMFNRVWMDDIDNRINDVPMPRLKYEFGAGFDD